MKFGGHDPAQAWRVTVVSVAKTLFVVTAMCVSPVTRELRDRNGDGGLCLVHNSVASEFHVIIESATGPTDERFPGELFCCGSNLSDTISAE